MKLSTKIFLPIILISALLILLVGCFPTINKVPIITSTPITLAEVDGLYTYDVNATDPDGDTLTYSLDVKPNGMTIVSATGVISWTPTSAQIGNNTVTVKVSDGTLDITQNFTIVVSEAAEPEPIKPDWLGIPQIDPDSIFTKETTDVHIIILVNYKSEDLASESPVKIFVQNENIEWSLLDEMFDDGNLENHGDEIKGDRIYSNIIEFYEESAKEIPLKIVVTTSDNQQYSVEFNISVFEDMTEQFIKDTEELSNLAEQKVIEIMQSPPSDLDTVIQMLRDYSAEQPYVESCEIFGNIIEVTFDTGVLMEIRLINLDEGEPTEGTSSSKVPKNYNLSSYENREKEYIPIPIESQTTGGDGFGYYLPRDTDHYLESKDISGVEYIGNRNILVYDPFYEYWTKWDYDVGSTYEELLDIDNSGIDFDIKICRDYQADIETLKTISDYGIVIIHTHGSGISFATGLEATETNKKIYENEMYKKEMYVSKHLAVSWFLGIVEIYEDKLGVKRWWFNSNNFPEDIPNSIIFNNSCSNGNEEFYNDFDSIGAATYYGHGGGTTRSNALECTTLVLEGLIDGKTTGEAYVAMEKWKMFGKEYVKIPQSIPFCNGGFEDGFMNWEKEGDGRILPALDFLEPTEGVKMGIISTGLGYTDKYGSLSQTFTVGNDDTTLQFDWNYLSEEFLEWIGSSFQDPFKVTITKVEDSSITTLLYKTVDDIAADFGASQSEGGDLIYVSPDIVFDQGDVWMTDWQNSTYDISAFQGNEVTIKFEAEDLGDEIFDTVILLDDIKVY